MAKQYSADAAQLRWQLEEERRNTQHKNEAYEPSRLVLKDTVTGTRYLITVASGALTLTAL